MKSEYEDSIGVVFDDAPKKRKPQENITEMISDTPRRDKILNFIHPVFQKLPKREATYWITLSLVGLFFTGMILRFVDSFIVEQDTYASNMSSIHRYSSIYDELDETISATPDPALKK